MAKKSVIDNKKKRVEDAISYQIKEIKVLKQSLKNLQTDLNRLNIA